MVKSDGNYRTRVLIRELLNCWDSGIMHIGFRKDFFDRELGVGWVKENGLRFLTHENGFVYLSRVSSLKEIINIDQVYHQKVNSVIPKFSQRKQAEKEIDNLKSECCLLTEILASEAYSNAIRKMVFENSFVLDEAAQILKTVDSLDLDGVANKAIKLKDQGFDHIDIIKILQTLMS